MRLLPHIFLAYAALGLQRGLGALLTVGTAARADVVLIVGGFLAGCLPRATAPIGTCLLGLAYDLTGDGPIGLHAASFGLAGPAAAALPANRWGRSLGAIVAFAAVASIVAYVLGLLRRGESAAALAWARPGLGATAGTILLTALLAVPASWLLWKVRRPFAADGSR